MKRITLLLLFCLVLTIAKAAYPQTLPINYTSFFATSAIGTDPTLEKAMYTTTGDAVQLNQWNRGYSITGYQSPTVETSTLSYSTYIDNNVGKAILLNSAATAARATVYSIATANEYLSGSFYLSALINISSAPSSVAVFLTYDKAAVANTYRGRIYIKSSGSGYVMSTGISGNASMYSSVLNYNQTYLIVLKFTNGASGNEVATLYLNPTIGDTETNNSTTAISTQSAVAASTYIRGIDVIQGAGIGGKIAGLRFSDNWSDVVKSSVTTPKLTTPTVLSATSITADGFTANWNSVSNVFGYTVNVYQGTTLATTSNVSSSNTSVAITGLNHGTTYTYKVIAKGNVTDYLDSDPSAASSDIITLGLPVPTVGAATSITDHGFTTNWSTVSNATGYSVQIIQGSTIINTLNVPDQSTTSLAINALKMGTSYSYNVIAKGDGTTTFDSSPSSSVNVITLSDLVNAINTDFGDGTWGPAASTTTFGSYGSRYINGYNLANATLYSKTFIGPKGETHTNAISVDKNSNQGIITLPELTNPIAQIEIHASSGSDTKSFLVKEYNSSTSTWDLIGTYNTMQVEGIYILNPISSSSTKFRIENNTTSGLFVSQIITRATNPTLLTTPTVGITSGVISTGFTSNWTPVSNATGYKVYVYNGNTLIAGSPFNVNGQSSNNYIVTGLTSATAYTYVVQAIGDGYINYSDSFLSFASPAITTLTDLGTGLNKIESKITVAIQNKEIVCSESGNIQIYNLQGSQVFQAKSVNKVETGLTNGLYIVKFTNKTGIQTVQKITIK